jgi:purine-binding chemotaxis protein CheW
MPVARVSRKQTKSEDPGTGVSTGASLPDPARNDTPSSQGPPAPDVVHEPALFFRVQSVWLAIPPTYVEEIADLHQLTKVPAAPAYLRGLVNLRGHAVPVIDLGQFLGLSSGGSSPDQGPDQIETTGTRIVVVAANGMRVGISCERVRGIVDVPQDQMHRPQVVQGRRLQEFARAELNDADSLVVFIDLPALLEAARLRS